MESGEVDALLVVGEFGYWGARFPELSEPGSKEMQAANDLASLAGRHDFPVVVATVNKGASPAVDRLLESGVPVYGELASAARVLAHLAHVETSRPVGLPEMPQQPDAPLTETDYWSVRQALALNGVPFAEARLVHGADEAVAAAGEIGYPVALKAMGLLHKSDAGGVALDIAGDRELRTAFADMRRRLSAAAFSVERMAPRAEGLELIIGCRQDQRFGPVVLAGLGGIYAEVLRDTAMALAPVTEDEALGLLTGLRCAPLMSGARGRAPLDAAAAARIAAALSVFAAAHPELAEIELNPVLVTPDGAVALDARAVPAATADET